MMVKGYYMTLQALLDTPTSLYIIPSDARHDDTYIVLASSLMRGTLFHVLILLWDRL